MAELLSRGYNVAVPEVDVGDDILAAADARGRMYRVQVKTCLRPRPLRREAGYVVQFHVRLRQLADERRPDLHYVLVLRPPAWSTPPPPRRRRPTRRRSWRGLVPRDGPAVWEFLVLSRRQLLAEIVDHGVGCRYASDTFVIRLVVRSDRIDGYGRNFQGYRNVWHHIWPRIEHCGE